MEAPKVEKPSGKNGKDFKCRECGKQFGHRSHLLRHIETVHSEDRPFECENCRSTFKRKDHLKVHTSRVHPKSRSNLKRSLISKALKSNAKKNDSLSRKVPRKCVAKKLDCIKCLEVFPRKIAVAKRKRSVKAKKKTAKRGKSLSVRRKKIVRRYRCDLCGNRYTRPYTVLQHKARNHGLRMPLLRWDRLNEAQKIERWQRLNDAEKVKLGKRMSMNDAKSIIDWERLYEPQNTRSLERLCFKDPELYDSLSLSDLQPIICLEKWSEDKKWLEDSAQIPRKTFRTPAERKQYPIVAPETKAAKKEYGKSTKKESPRTAKSTKKPRPAGTWRHDEMTMPSTSGYNPLRKISSSKLRVSAKVKRNCRKRHPSGKLMKGTKISPQPAGTWRNEKTAMHSTSRPSPLNLSAVIHRNCRYKHPLHSSALNDLCAEFQLLNLRVSNKKPCPACEREFDNTSGLLEHFVKKHDRFVHCCETDGCVTSPFASLAPIEPVVKFYPAGAIEHSL